ncbi:putative DUF3027 family protein [Corynebacterium mustelae]|uniref:Putative DUF3027 family protein n=1 Tax=Corynebacterium mustelae TaxID=571915 RepID=A0A0G3H2G0_9CORY|nr:DUF3027 domain-containing protein [Corynebacterium mustelae]AKK05277.1 putative DUF3027 family protein [Corynebacterium mustelae]
MGNNGLVPRKRSRNRKNAGLLLSPLAISIAREALEELGEGDIGDHKGVTNIGAHVVTHRFAANVPGYNGWEWNVVIACAAGSQWITVSEIALVPGGTALKAPDWVPYHERIQPGDLGPGDYMPARLDDERLTDNPADFALPEPVDTLSVGSQAPAAVDDSGLAKTNTVRRLSTLGLQQAIGRWRDGEFGPQSPFAQRAEYSCASCAFYLPVVAPAKTEVGVCANEFSADGSVVASDYGCGAHSLTPPAEPLGVVESEAFDDEKPIEVEF